MQRAEQVLFSNNNSALRKAHLTLTRKSSQTLRSLFDTRADVINKYVVQLKDSGHPILGVASELCIEGPAMCSLSTSLQLRAILVLLITKSLGFSSALRSVSKEVQEKVEAKQFSISEITELIYTAHVLHRTVVNTSDPNSPLHQGNKLAALMGDLLLAKSSRLLSNLRNNQVTELMSQSICDFSESEFIGVTADTLNSHTKSKLYLKDMRERFNYATWLRRSELSLGSLLGHACYCCVIFGGHDEAIQKFAFHLGKQVGLTLQAYKDIRVFEDEYGVKMKLTQTFDPLNLPVIFEVEQIPTSTSEEQTFDLQMIFDQVQSSPTAIPRAKENLLRLQQDSVRLFRQIEPKTSATELLSEILETFSS